MTDKMMVFKEGENIGMTCAVCKKEPAIELINLGIRRKNMVAHCPVCKAMHEEVFHNATLEVLTSFSEEDRDKVLCPECHTLRSEYEIQSNNQWVKIYCKCGHQWEAPVTVVQEVAWVFRRHQQELRAKYERIINEQDQGKTLMEEFEEQKEKIDGD